MRSIKIFAAVAAAALSSAAQAGTELQMDLNSLTATANGPFGTNFTGTITLTKDSNSTLNAILIDGVDQNIASGQLNALTGSITIAGGTVTGGSFSVTDTSNNVYTASIVNASGTVTTSAGQTGPFRIDGLTFQGFFNNATFAGVDVTDWQSVQPLNGSFLQFKFGPNANGVDIDSDVDLFVVVPIPTAVGMASLGLLGIGSIRRRR